MDECQPLVHGIIISNTTVARPAAVAAHPHGAEPGGLSGAPLMDPSTEVLSDMYRLTKVGQCGLTVSNPS